ncbi:MAG: EAL and HDOD domain-containing protein, partial [Rubrivivax sp.]
RIALTIVPIDALSAPEINARIQPGMMFALTDPAIRGPDEGAMMRTLKSRGGLMGSLGLPRAGASFVVLDAMSLSLEALLERAQACRRVAPGCQLMATGLRTIDDMEAAIRGPVEMATGLFDKVGERRESGAVSPNVQRLCRLINRAMNEPDTRQLGEEIRADVDLTYRLLRHANSPLLGLKRQVDSVDQALQILGRQALFRWLTILLVASAQGRSTSIALQEIALARAHFMESLAHEVWAPSATLYTTGLLSLLDVMMQQPMETLLEPLGLSEESRAALLHRSGPWHVLLELARSLETGQVQSARALSKDVGGLAGAQAAMDKAWQAAAAMSAELRDGQRRGSSR